MAELEELIESYRTFATSLTLSTSVERADCPQARCAKTRHPSASPATDARRARKEPLFVDEEKADNRCRLLPNPRCQKTHDAYVLSARTPSPPSLLIPLRMDVKSGWVG